MWRMMPFIVIALQGLVYYSFIKYLRTTNFYKPSYKWWILLPFVLFNGTFLIVRFFWGREFDPPPWFRYGAVYPFYIWISATFFISLWLLLGKLIKLPFQIPLWIAKLISPLRKKITAISEKKNVRQADLSRRMFVRYATMGIAAYGFAGAAYGMIRHDAYRIERRDIKIENLPPELVGTTITLICDIHSGQYMTESEMREYADVVNELGSDIICMPGDFVTYGSEQVSPLTRAFRDLKAKHGIYGSLGNHDFFQNGDFVAGAISGDTPIQMLRNDYRKISIKGKELYIIGVDDTRGAGSHMEAVIGYYENTESKLRSDSGGADISGKPKILLCHKPYAFDELAKKNIDLVLSGHTHGGQVVPFKFGSFNLSFAAIASKYVEGLYKVGKSQMYVSRGIGTTILPIRLNSPPEVTVITLV